MRKLYLILGTAVLLASCVKELDRSAGVARGEEPVPADFYWEMTRDTEVSVAAPTVGGVEQSANVRIFCSPVLYAKNLVAKGVAGPGKDFRTVLTLPSDVRTLYVQTTLPDGTTALKTADVLGTVRVPGVVMSHSTSAAVVYGLERTRVESSIPTYPRFEIFERESDFEAGAVIRTAPSKVLQPGSDASPYSKYFIPKGTQIDGKNIGLKGGDGSGERATPVIYVAGKLTLTGTLEKVSVVVLPSGVVEAKSLFANNAGTAQRPTLFICEGGEFSAENINFSCKTIVNEGKFEIGGGKMDINNGVVFYNGPTGELEADDAAFTNNTVLYNDGDVKFDKVEFNSNTTLCNCENGTFEVEDKFMSSNASVEVWQRGVARIEKLQTTGGGVFHILCYTYVEKIEGGGAQYEIAAGAGLDAEEIELEWNTQVSLGAGSIITTEELETGGTTFTSLAGDGIPAVIVITDDADCGQWSSTVFKGPMEVVYDGDGISERCFRTGTGAVLRKKQTAVIPPSFCNDGKTPVVPEPDPLPEEEYNMEQGRTVTYCFEDRWPWIGDYDMNDVVLATRTDREISKDGSKVKSVTINWTLKAAGTQVGLGCAVQMDRVRASQVTGVTTSHDMGPGPFAVGGLEAGNDFAVIPFFNTTSELLSGANTYRERPYVEPVTHTTTVTFAEPVDVADVLESSMNYFIVVGERGREIHRPGFEPTKFAVVGDGHFNPADPYRYFVKSGEHTKDNHLMWALMIPDDFRYPAEGVGHDIRDVYTYFRAWAVSGGTEHADWYKDEANEPLLY